MSMSKSNDTQNYKSQKNQSIMMMIMIALSLITVNCSSTMAIHTSHLINYFQLVWFHWYWVLTLLKVLLVCKSQLRRRLSLRLSSSIMQLQQGSTSGTAGNAAPGGPGANLAEKQPPLTSPQLQITPLCITDCGSFGQLKVFCSLWKNNWYPKLYHKHLNTAILC